MTEIVVVTGASRGVGRATAMALVREHGVHVLAVARNEDRLNDLRKELGALSDHLTPLTVDLTDPDAVPRIMAAVGERRVRALINNAGLLISRPFGEWTVADLEQVFTTNAFVPLLLVQALKDRLRGDPRGHVVNIGSMGGFQGSSKFPGLMGYSASKAALSCMSECLAEELKDFDVACNCLALGSVDTEMLRAAFPDHKASMDAARMGSYVARFALEGHAFHNGKVLPVSSSTP